MGVKEKGCLCRPEISEYCFKCRAYTTAKSEYRSNPVNNESRHADDAEERELRHDTLSLTHKLATQGLFWTPTETPY